MIVDRWLATAADPGRAMALMVAASAIVFYVLAGLGLLSGVDAAIWMIVVALLSCALRPYLLLICAGIQDAPGFAYPYSYGGFLAIGALVLLQEIMRLAVPRSSHEHTVFNARLWLIVGAAVLVAIYATANSVLQETLHGMAQAATRAPLAVGLLIGGMAMCAGATVQSLRRSGQPILVLRTTLLLVLGHSLVVAVGQVFAGPEFYRSPIGAGVVLEAAQLTDPTLLGIPRIASTYLSPNAFTVSAFACVVTVIASYGERKPGAWTRAAYVLTGLGTSVLSLSRSMLAFFLASSVAVLGRRTLVAAFVIASASIAWLVALAPIVTETAAEVLRLQGADFGYRQLAWSGALHELRPYQWVTGIGLSAWPVVLEPYVGLPLADPHGLLLSLPGTFGIPGVLLYLVLAACLVKEFRAARAGSGTRVAVLLLALLLFGRDLVAIPTLLGNTPLSFLIWVPVLYVISAPAADCRRRTAHMPSAPEATVTGAGH